MKKESVMLIMLFPEKRGLSVTNVGIFDTIRGISKYVLNM